MSYKDSLQEAHGLISAALHYMYSQEFESMLASLERAGQRCQDAADEFRREQAAYEQAAAMKAAERRERRGR